MDIDGTDTHANLGRALARESEANQRNLWFAQRADVEGYPEVAALFRSIADAGTGHAHGFLEFLAQTSDPVTRHTIGDTADNLAAAEAGETYGSTQMYPEFARTARDEGLVEVAEWFESVARAHTSDAGRISRQRRSLT